MPYVGVVMGSISDWETMQHTCETLESLGISFEKDVISAHRTPDKMFSYAKTAEDRDLKIIIAGAGGAAHLPGMIASQTNVPVIGVPIKTSTLHGVDSLLSIVQMPAGVPTATMAIGKAGAINAALFAGKMIGQIEPTVASALKKYKEQMQENVQEMRDDLAKK